MLFSICTTIFVIIAMILLILFKPNFKFKNHNIDTFFIPPLIGALLLICFKIIPFNYIYDTFSTNTSVNPLKILILFISISLLSVALDELGFFRYIAYITIKKCKVNQYSLFFTLYLLISVLTVFTSNDIVILTFTPFICYFAKNAKINPIPYLVMEFVNANTYSMLLSIGNPTNIYISSYFSINFLEYFKIMFLPTLLSGIFTLVVLMLLFHKELNNEIKQIELQEERIKNKSLTIINLIHLTITTVLLIIANYINIEMWIICFLSAISLTVFLLCFSINKHDFALIKGVFRRLPYTLIPFVIGMFIIVLSLNYTGLIGELGNILNRFATTKKTSLLCYLMSSTFADNLINNIPMSVLFSEVLQNISSYRFEAIYATIAGSNIGAYLTPIGALAGIMWMSLLKSFDVKYNFLSFIKYGLIIVPFALLGAFIGLTIIL